MRSATLNVRRGREGVRRGRGAASRCAPRLTASRRGPASPYVPPLVEKPVEVFELEIDEEDDAEEIMLLEEEATDPGRKDPRKP